MRYICALTIAGSDCSGGAGIQADIKTMSALGVYAATAITSITVQNTKVVQAVHGVNPFIVADQIKAVMDDLKPDAVKIGMVNDSATIHAIADTLKHYPKCPIVIDPIMVSTSGFNLMKPDALELFCHSLLPMSTLLTPNLPETEILSNMKIKTIDDIAAQKIMSLGCNAVLMKGGHIDGGEKVDRLYMANGGVQTFTHKTIDTRNTHGTGCTLSSAITSYIARGLELTDAIAAAKNYLSQALAAGKDIHIGEGHGPVNHLFNPEKLITL
mgnify:CR=1 FL=1